MAAVLTDHQMISVAKTVSGNTPRTLAINEKASQTFLAGVPVMASAGVIKEWDASVGAASSTVGIAGVSRSFGANLASDGLGVPGVLQPFTGAGAVVTVGNVPYQPSAKTIPYGAPFTDGRTLLEVAQQDTIFEAQFDDAGGSTTNATTNQNMIGKQFGLTKDTTGHWYVDFAKVTAGTNTVVIIVALHPNDGAKQNGRVWFKFIDSIAQLAN